MDFPHGGNAGIRCINQLDGRLQQALAEHPNASIFHTAEWLLTLQQSYGYRPCCFLRETDSGDEFWPFLEVDSRLTGRRAVSLPFTDFFTPLFAQSDAPALFWDAILAKAERAGWKYVEIRGGHPSAADAAPSAKYLLHRLPLTAGEEALWRDVSSNHRRNIRRAEKLGLKIVRGHSAGMLSEFYWLNQLTRRRHGLPPQPLTFFKNLRANILDGTKGELIIAYRQSLPIAGAVFLKHNNEVIYKYGASRPEAAATGANHLVMWNAILSYSASGWRSLHFGKTAVFHEGLRRFKTGWGALEEETAYFRLNVPDKRFIRPQIGESGWYNRVFRRMPLTLSRILGRLLYKHVA